MHLARTGSFSIVVKFLLLPGGEGGIIILRLEKGRMSRGIPV